MSHANLGHRHYQSEVGALRPVIQQSPITDLAWFGRRRARVGESVGCPARPTEAAAGAPCGRLAHASPADTDAGKDCSMLPWTPSRQRVGASNKVRAVQSGTPLRAIATKIRHCRSVSTSSTARCRVSRSLHSDSPTGSRPKRSTEPAQDCRGSQPPRASADDSTVHLRVVVPAAEPSPEPAVGYAC